MNGVVVRYILGVGGVPNIYVRFTNSPSGSSHRPWNRPLWLQVVESEDAWRDRVVRVPPRYVYAWLLADKIPVNDGCLKYYFIYLWGSNWCKCRVSLRDVLLRMHCWGWKYNTPCSPCDTFTTLWKPRWKLKTDPSERKIPLVHLHVQVPCYFSGEYLGPKVINGRIKVAN